MSSSRFHVNGPDSKWNQENQGRDLLNFQPAADEACTGPKEKGALDPRNDDQRRSASTKQPSQESRQLAQKPQPATEKVEVVEAIEVAEAIEVKPDPAAVKAAEEAAKARQEQERGETLESLQRAFHLNGFSETGEAHQQGDYRHLGNQDRWGLRVHERAVVLVVCDGCSSTDDPSFGARAVTRIVTSKAIDLLNSTERLMRPEEFAKAIEKEVLSGIAQIARVISGSEDTDRTVHDYFLCTTLIGVVTPEWWAILGSGDGCIAVNGQRLELDAKEGNRPEYIAYMALKERYPGFDNIRFRVFKKGDTRDLRSMAIASDGMKPVLDATHNGFTFSDLWEKPEFRSGTAVKETVARLVSKESRWVTKEGPMSFQAKLVEVSSSPFEDDWTCVFLNRNAAEPLPVSWNVYRQKHGLSLDKSDSASRKRTGPILPLGGKQAKRDNSQPPARRSGTEAVGPQSLEERRGDESSVPASPVEPAWRSETELVGTGLLAHLPLILFFLALAAWAQRLLLLD